MCPRLWESIDQNISDRLLSMALTDPKGRKMATELFEKVTYTLNKHLHDNQNKFHGLKQVAKE